MPGVDVLDDLDRELLRLLKEDARRSYRTLARMASTTPPTAASRIRRMEDIGVIKGYSVRLDPALFGSDEAQVDLEDQIRLECHQCKRPTAEPHWANVDGRRHPFCCTTCRSTFLERHARLAEGL